MLCPAVHDPEPKSLVYYNLGIRNARQKLILSSQESSSQRIPNWLFVSKLTLEWNEDMTQKLQGGILRLLL
jgi:hypothetical protein